MNVSVLLLLAASVVLLADAPLQAKEQAVHFIKTTQLEFVDNGGLETVTLEVKADSFESPFTWVLTVTNATGVLFSVSRDDQWLDGFFSDPGYVTGCHGYAECKKKWYFSDLVKAVESAAIPAFVRATAPADWEIEALRGLATDYLAAEKVAPEQIAIAIREMRESLVKGAPMFVVPLSPVQDDSTFMYVRSLNRFVPYWDD